MSAPVSVRRFLNLIAINPVSIAPQLVPHLTWKKQVRATGRWQTGSPNYYTTVEEPLYNITEKGIITFAGFTQRVMAMLKPYGTINYIDDRGLVLPVPDRSHMDGLRFKQADALEAIWANDSGGIIDCVTAWGKTTEIVKVVQSYPQLRIAIVAPGAAAVKTLRDRLASFNVETGVVDGSNNSRRRVTLVSDRSLMKFNDNGDLQNVDLILFDECHKAAAPSTRVALTKAYKARMFGFTASHGGRSDNGDIVVEGLFGPVIMRVNYDEAVEAGVVAPMYVIMMETRGSELNVADPQAKTRHGVWRNRYRNADFANVAAACREMGQTLVLTATLEHGINLHRMLGPEWALVYGSLPKATLPTGREPTRSEVQAVRRAQAMLEVMKKSNIEMLDQKRLHQLQDQFTAGTLQAAVATGVWSYAVDFPKCQFVIRADAMTSDIQSKQATGRGSRLGTDTGIVIDGEDSWDSTLKRRAEARLRIYKQQKWTILRHKSPQEIPAIVQAIIQQARSSKSVSPPPSA